jgi:hypothetical protein
MRVSQVALLSLVASTAAPVFAAPISHYRARSENAGASLSAREPEGTSDVRDQNVPREITPELGARFTTEDLLKILNSRDLGPEQEIRSRGLFDLVDFGLKFLSNFIRRDLAPESLARDGMGGSVNSIISRDSSPGERMRARGSYEDLLTLLNARRSTFSDILDTFSEHTSTSGPSRRQETQARSEDNTSAFLKALLQSRDVSSDEVRARDSSAAELAGRSSFTDLMDAISQHSSREPSPQQETQARSEDNTSAFLKALLQSRDVSSGEVRARDSSAAELAGRSFLNDPYLEALLRSREVSDDDVLELLRSRAMDDLD